MNELRLSMQTTDYEEKGNPQQYEGSGRRQSSMGFANNASATSNTNFNNVRRYSTAYISYMLLHCNRSKYENVTMCPVS